MSCKVPNYIDKQPFSQQEKERLTGIAIDIFDKSKASGAFRGKDVLVALKNEFGKATAVVARINKEYDKPIAKLEKIKSTGYTEQFALKVNVLPLSNEQQGEINFSIYGLKDDLSPGKVNKFVRKYLPNELNEPKDVLERLIADTAGVEAKKGLEVLLRNVDKIQTKLLVSKPRAYKAIGEFHVERSEGEDITTEIRISPNALTDEEQTRHVIAHELHHAYSVAVLQNPITENEQNFNASVRRIASDLGVNPYEFVAELGSNKDFRDTLRGGLLDRIMRLIRKLLGLSNEYDKVLDHYYKVLDAAEDLTPSSTDNFLFKTKVPKEAKKRLDSLEQMINALNQRRIRYESQGLGKKGQEAEKDIDTLKKLVTTNRNIAIVKAVVIIEKETLELQKTYDELEKEPANINPDVLRNMGLQLGSYQVLESMVNDIRRNPTQYIGDTSKAPEFIKQINELRSKVHLLTEDVKELNKKRVAHFIANRTNDPAKNYENILDRTEVADRDISWWSRLFETARGVADEFVVGVHRTLDQVYGKAHRDNVTEDIYRKDQKVEEVTYKTSRDKGWFDNKFKIKTVGIVKAEEDYEAWLKKNGKNVSTLADKYASILNKETLEQNSNGVLFISPLSREGRNILSIKEGSTDYPLRQYYETIVLGYLKSQEAIKNPVMRPGLRIPSIQRSVFEGVINEKGLDKFKLFKESLIHNIRKRSDDTDFRAVNENLEPIHYLPVRFTSRQDGTEGRMTTREVSLDVAATVGIFMNEMRTREGMLKIQSDLELVKEVTGERKVVKATKRLNLAGIGGWLTRERKVLHDPESGLAERKEGTESESYKMIDTLLRRFMYGEYKQDAGDVTIFGKKVDVRKGINTLLRYTGMNIMLGNIAIPLTNVLVGEFTMFKEAIGGNLINLSNLKAGNKIYKDAALGAIADLGQREKKSKYGRVYMYFNPLGHERPTEHLGVDHNWMKTTLSHLFRSGGDIAEYKMSSEAVGAVLDRFKIKDSTGKEHSFYDGINVDMNGKVALQKGFTYKDSKELKDADIAEIRDYILRVYQLANGNYSRMDSPGATETIAGDLVMFMRKWLPEGIAARWKTRYYDESLQQQHEGYYISALAAFNGIFTRSKGLLPRTLDTLRMLSFLSLSDPNLLLLPNELNLPEDQKQDIINLRKAGIKKALVDLYLISALSLAMFALAGGDDDDSYVLYMLTRIRRELLTFINPVTAWDVVRSPSVVMNTIGGFHRIIDDIGSSGWATIHGEDQPVYKSGPGKGVNKLLFDVGRQTGVNGWLYQFDNLEQKTRLMQGGGWR